MLKPRAPAADLSRDVLIIVAIASIGGLLLGVAIARRERAQDNLTPRWRAVDTIRRRRIARAIRQGSALADPEDARLAVELIDGLRRLERSSGRTTAYRVVLIAVEIVLLVAGHWASIVMLLPLLGLEAAGRLYGGRERMERARALNVQVVEAWGGTVPAPAVAAPEPTTMSFRARAARITRWVYLGWLAVSVSLTVLVAIAGFQREDLVLLGIGWGALAWLLLVEYALTRRVLSRQIAAGAVAAIVALVGVSLAAWRALGPEQLSPFQEGAGQACATFFPAIRAAPTREAAVGLSRDMRERLDLLPRPPLGNLQQADYWTFSFSLRKVEEAVMVRDASTAQEWTAIANRWVKALGLPNVCLDFPLGDGAF